MKSHSTFSKPGMHGALALALSLTSAACGGGGGSENNSSFSVAYFPADLAVASPTETGSGGNLLRTRTDRTTREVRANDPIYGEDYATIIATLVKMLDGPTSAADCAFTLDLAPQFQDASCFGPGMTYSNHPDGSGPGNLPTGDLGIWEETYYPTGEACAAAQLNERMNGIARLTNGGIFLAASAYCSATVAGLTLPTTTGGTLAITSQLSANLSSGGNALTLTSADIICNSGDGTSCQEFSVVAAGSVDLSPTDGTFFLRLKHRPSSASFAEYTGKLSYFIKNPNATENNCQSTTVSGNTGVTYAASIGYEKGSSSSLKYRLDSGVYCGAEAEEDPFVSASNFTVDATKRANADNPTTDTSGWSGNYTRVLADFDPEGRSGDYSLTWQAGPLDSHARTLLIQIDALAATTAGVAFFGYGPTVQASTAGDITGMICNWTGPNHNHTTHFKLKAQKQSFKRAGDIYESVAGGTQITYAPTNSCDITSAEAAFTQIINAGAEGSRTGTSDILSTDTITNNLVGISDVSVTPPSSPTDVD
jgi:hypothetical protein